jgi:PBP1b-binding outer membrane lipoprotein LpoB
MRGLSIYFVVGCALAAFLAGCAGSPEDIPPANVSEVTYQPLSCQDLTDLSGQLDGALATATSQENTSEISRIRRDLKAIKRVFSQKQCSAS